MAVTAERKQQIYVAALTREQAAAAEALDTAIEKPRTAVATDQTPFDPVAAGAEADAVIDEIRKARNYLADVTELLTLAQNPGA